MDELEKKRQEYIYTVTVPFLFIKSTLYFLYCYTILFIKNSQ